MELLFFYPITNTFDQFVYQIGLQVKHIFCLFVDAARSTPKPQRQVNENRGRFRSQPSYSSQSDEDSPRDRGSRGNRRPRSHKYQRNQEKPGTLPAEALPAESKPPLPPSKSKINEDDDGSWEDMTTSGTESLGEEMQSTNSTPPKSEPTTVEPADHPFDQFLEKVGVSAPDVPSESGGIKALDEEDIVLNQSHESGKSNESDECLSLEVSHIISSTDISLENMTMSNTVISSVTGIENCDTIASSKNKVEEKHAPEIEPKFEILDSEEVKICSEETTVEEMKLEYSGSFNKEETFDSSIDKTRLDKVEDIEPSKLLFGRENLAKEKEIGNNSEIKTGESLKPHDD